ncbi:MBL fold metallo-hydrolase [Kineococcus rhizosphaerae]|uniref:Glyoxylase-like metal-dependent hydrolase (Beta-lactamase superfamily II) n=1 Tax=Kineococcus rhizosphaerae TaxID=559628 RepID=A0A2T0R5U3_9ACTN|nr:MBL fold metallo-hydrolase [Kineococcus rhizosphaerae]PRY16141.1 glyoxylase-like metal-dependent hydrolase (beta-lactamase superfamily II) [Kineococcus rhizosphaerae]
MSAPEPWTGGPVTDRATCVLQGNAGPMTLDGTNTWLLAAPGAPDVVVVDPGEDDAVHRAAIARVLAGRPVALVVGTHHHHDHVGGLAAFVAEHPAPVVRTAGRHRAAGLDLRVLATPGHTADSLSVLLGTGELLTGDTVLGRGSTVIADDGDLGDHLASLDLLLGLGAGVLLPGHGPVRTDADAALRTQREHRLARLEQVRRAWAAGHRDVDDVVEAVHGPLEGKLRWAAAQSIRAQLHHLGYG